LAPSFFGELVGGEGLAEAHLRVPEEARDGVHVLLPDGVEVGVGLVHGLGLLAAHREGLVMRAGEPLAGAQFGEHGLHVGDRAAHPLQLGFSKPFWTSAARTSWSVKKRAVVALGGFVQFDR
jgi:hypothetical protein